MKMMKFFLLAAAVAAAISCVKESLPAENENPAPEAELVPMTFTATADNGEAETKVFYDGQTKTTQWKSGDKIAVISSNGTASTFEAVEVSEDGKTAVFEGLAENAETYYAVSPASAYKGDGKEVLNGTLYVNIPEVQNAVAGSFDPTAFVSVATNNGGTLSFKNSCTVVKFRLNDAENVKSVRFTANEVKNLAGTQNVLTTKIPTHSWGSPFDGRSSYDMITLNAPAEGFVADTDYYMTMRPQTMAKGINLYIEYTDCVKVRKGASSFAAGVNKIRDLKAIDASGLEDITLYEGYQMGFDVNLGGYTINKSTHGDAILMETDSEIKTNGIYFVKEGVTASYTGTEGIKNLIVIGNKPGERSVFKTLVNAYMKLNGGGDGTGYLAFHNIVFDQTATSSQYAITVNTNETFPLVLFSNCEIRQNSAKPIFYIANAARSIADLRFIDCDCNVTSTQAFLACGSVASSYGTYTVSNCVFYGDGTKAFNLHGGNKVTYENIVFTNNTFVNVAAGSNIWFNAGTIKNATVAGNLLFMDKSLSNNISVLNSANAAVESGRIENNVCYTGQEKTFTAIYGGTSKWFEGVTEITKLTSDPFAGGTFDMTNGIFVPGAEYASYGATR